MTNNKHGLQLPRTMPPYQPKMAPAAPQVKYWNYTEPGGRPEVEGTEHLHWGITAFHSLDESGQLRDSLLVEVEAPSEVEAIARAMMIVQRECYRVSWVKESCSIDPALKEK